MYSKLPVAQKTQLKLIQLNKNNKTKGKKLSKV